LDLAAEKAMTATESGRAIRSIVGASSGNLVEWFDFYVYSFTSIYFAASFFPKSDPTAQLLSTAAIFAVGFFIRPVGSWFFGRVADRHGRRTSMVWAVMLMSLGSMMIACLPTYQSVGAAAPALLLVARLIQGFSVGGEYGTSATYMSEVALAGRRGFYASFQYMTLIGGQLAATVVLVVLQAFLSVEQLRAWGWRIPFVVGALAALVALVLRRSLDETTTAETRARSHAGTIRGILQHPRALWMVIGITACSSGSFYAYTTYMQKYLVNSAHFDPKVATNVMTAALFCFMMLQPIFGALSDKIGRRTAMLTFSVFVMVMTVPLMKAIGASTSPYVAFGLILAILTGASFYTSISGVVKAELFPVEVRALGVGLAYALPNALFGGTLEYVALWFKQRGIESALFWYVAALGAVCLAASLALPRREAGYMADG
jgi:MHS family alpha-ketoglutarate permease-like MFS transporter